MRAMGVAALVRIDKSRQKIYRLSGLCLLFLHGGLWGTGFVLGLVFVLVDVCVLGGMVRRSWGGSDKVEHGNAAKNNDV